jgi:hypothetical protein
MVFSFNLPTPSECTCGSPDVVGTNPPALPKLHSVGRLQSVIDAVNSTFWPEAEEEEEEQEEAWTREELEGVQKILQFKLTKLSRELEELSAIQARVEAVRAVLGVREGYTAWEARLDLVQETMVAFGMAPEPNTWIKPVPGDLHDSDISSFRGPPPSPTESSDDAWWSNPGNGHQELAWEKSKSAERSMGSGFEEDGVWIDKYDTDEPSLMCTCGLGARVPSAPPPSMSSSRASERGSPVPATKW